MYIFTLYRTPVIILTPPLLHTHIHSTVKLYRKGALQTKREAFFKNMFSDFFLKVERDGELRAAAGREFQILASVVQKLVQLCLTLFDCCPVLFYLHSFCCFYCCRCCCCLPLLDIVSHSITHIFRLLYRCGDFKGIIQFQVSKMKAISKGKIPTERF